MAPRQRRCGCSRCSCSLADRPRGHLLRLRLLVGSLALRGGGTCRLARLPDATMEAGFGCREGIVQARDEAGQDRLSAQPLSRQRLGSTRRVALSKGRRNQARSRRGSPRRSRCRSTGAGPAGSGARVGHQRADLDLAGPPALEEGLSRRSARDGAVPPRKPRRTGHRRFPRCRRR